MTGIEVTLTALDAPTRALVPAAAAIATGNESQVELELQRCLAASVPAVWVDELLLQSLLMVGWPRTLNAAGVWRRVGPAQAAPGEDGTDYTRAPEWLARGHLVCSTVYGESYERLRGNMRTLHPAIEAWMVVEGYGKTLGRSGLDLPRRELCVVAQLAVQGAKRQLHAHLRGALNAGAAPAAVTEALGVITEYLGPRELDLAFSLWRRIHR